MKITGVKTYIIDANAGKNWLLVKVTTDEGITGWGEAYTQSDRDTAQEAHIKQMSRYLIGRSPFNIKHFTKVMYDDFAARRGAMDFWCAVSGLEHAMWDIVGKKTGQPVYNLLGGAVRDKIKVYANGWSGSSGTPDDFAKKAMANVNLGFTAMKFDPFPGPWRTYISRKDELTAVERVKVVRDAVGPDVDILIEVHRRLAPMHAVRVAHMMEEYRPFWYEEPTSSANIDNLAEVRGKINIPTVTGEELYTKDAFREIFEKHAVDIINPDICSCGGILEMKEIAAMAEPYSIVVSPHNYNSTTIGLAASIQAAALIPNFLILEYFVNWTVLGNEIAVNPFKVENSYINVPQTPGLGLEINEEAILKHPYRQGSQRNIRMIADEGP